MDSTAQSTGSTFKKHSKYKKIKSLGKGAFGNVSLIQIEGTKEHRVLKEISLKDMEPKEKENCLREAKIMEILQHEFIVGYHDVFKTKGGKLCIIMEYCSKGDIDKEIKKRAS